ncbi:cytochrome c oxidase subunit 3 [Mucilaginibacter segetis]|uniref:Heme-copper oxidase subunit III n=1 Tax=Mucilaginibacter segetis TaxID=2793071 RepID=A0A934UN51_9SPHI|nr:heme-copper oxidase subunit III [Mucilaginibacter segetis]MBK0379690.1 heme-copper oxidase subunit III [Mucilaginibacter segetis]
MENKLMIKLVVGTEAMFFLSLIMVFVYFSLAPGFVRLQTSELDLRSTGMFSLVLFSSSFTYWRAEKNYHKGNIGMLKLWLIVTFLLGAIFLFGQGKEYIRLFNDHVNLGANTFGTSFFTLTGFHGLHVLVGLIIIAIVTALAVAGDYDEKKSSVISTVGIYWHFVDIVWAVVFFIVYVIPHIR